MYYCKYCRSHFKIHTYDECPMCGRPNASAKTREDIVNEAIDHTLREMKKICIKVREKFLNKMKLN